MGQDPEKQKHAAAVLLGQGQLLYLECWLFSAKTLLNASSRKHGYVASPHSSQGWEPLAVYSAYLAQCSPRGQEGIRVLICETQLGADGTMRLFFLGPRGSIADSDQKAPLGFIKAFQIQAMAPVWQGQLPTPSPGPSVPSHCVYSLSFSSTLQHWPGISQGTPGT